MAPCVPVETPLLENSSAGSVDEPMFPRISSHFRYAGMASVHFFLLEMRQIPLMSGKSFPLQLCLDLARYYH